MTFRRREWSPVPAGQIVAVCLCRCCGQRTTNASLLLLMSPVWNNSAKVNFIRSFISSFFFFFLYFYKRNQFILSLLHFNGRFIKFVTFYYFSHRPRFFSLILEPVCNNLITALCCGLIWHDRHADLKCKDSGCLWGIVVVTGHVSVCYIVINSQTDVY